MLTFLKPSRDLINLKIGQLKGSAADPAVLGELLSLLPSSEIKCFQFTANSSCLIDF